MTLPAIRVAARPRACRLCRSRPSAGGDLWWCRVCLRAFDRFLGGSGWNTGGKYAWIADRAWRYAEKKRARPRGQTAQKRTP